MHIHFSKLEYTDKGEKRHVPFSIREAGPKPSLFLRSLPARQDFNPVIICESPNSYADGRRLQRNHYARLQSIQDEIRL